jgi:hypothetical protein
MVPSRRGPVRGSRSWPPRAASEMHRQAPRLGRTRPAQSQSDADAEGLRGCAGQLSQRVDELNPSFIGYTGRRLTAYPAQAPDDDDAVRRCVMKVSPWTAVEKPTGEHPRLFVANGTHSLYLMPGTVNVDPYPAESAPHNCGRPTSTRRPRRAPSPESPLSWLVVEDCRALRHRVTN